jgi:acylphosphatase
VQGVGFRYFVQRVGKRLGLAGNVRNLPDSTVEIMVEGDSPKIERFIEEVRKGPPMAWVEKLDIEETVPARSYPGFLIEGW